MPKFTATDSGLNARGGRVLTAGGDLSTFRRNPIMLWMHDRFGDRLPIGRWKNIVVSDQGITMEPEFDMDDEYAAEIARKVEKRILNAVSIGIRILELSEDPALMLPGQTRPTITKWELLEVSIVDIPANRNAMRLYELNDDGQPVLLAEEKLAEAYPVILPKTQDNMPTFNEDIRSNLGLKPGATDQEVLTALAAMKEKAEKKPEDAPALLVAEKDKAIEQLTAKVEQLTASQASVKELLESLKDAGTPSGGGQVDNKKYSEMTQQEREKLFSEDRQKFNELVAAEFPGSGKPGVFPTAN